MARMGLFITATGLGPASYGMAYLAQSTIPKEQGGRPVVPSDRLYSFGSPFSADQIGPVLWGDLFTTEPGGHAFDGPVPTQLAGKHIEVQTNTSISGSRYRVQINIASENADGSLSTLWEWYGYLPMGSRGVAHFGLEAKGFASDRTLNVLVRGSGPFHAPTGIFRALMGRDPFPHVAGDSRWGDRQTQYGLTDLEAFYRLERRIAARRGGRDPHL